MISDIFYDDEPDEPNQTVRDALTELMHIAADRGIDFDDALARAWRMRDLEREEWGIGP